MKVYCKFVSGIRFFITKYSYLNYIFSKSSKNGNKIRVHLA